MIYINIFLGIYNCFDDIDFDKLPSQFVLKTNHDSASVFICKNKKDFDFAKARKLLTESLKRNFYLTSREWPYKNVPRRILAESFMKTNNGKDLDDYKFFCFNGEVKFLKVDFDRFEDHHANYYNCKWKLLPFGEKLCPPKPEKKIAPPVNFDKMVKIAAEISKGYPFVRVDLYNIEGDIFFGEMTFFPASGLGWFVPEEWDIKLGEMLKLPPQKLN